MSAFKRWITMFIVIALGLAATGCGGQTTTSKSSESKSGTTAAASSTLRIGLLTQLSGSLGSTGQAQVDGFNLYLAQHGGKLGGHPVQTFSVDDQGNPSTAISGAKQLVELDHVNALIGTVNSTTALAVHSYLDQHQMPTLLAANLDTATDGQYVFRTTFPVNPDSYLIGYLAGKAGFRKAVIVAPKYSAGEAVAKYFTKGFEDAGGSILKTILAPFPTTIDFSPYLSSFPANADVCLAFEPGSEGIRFVQAYKQTQLQGKLPIYGFPSTVDETLLPAEGQAAVGFVGPSTYFPTIDTPANKAFVQAYVAKYKAEPSYISFGGYLAAEILDAAVTSVGGNIGDSVALAKAISSVTIQNTPAGPFSFDKQGNPIMARYIGQIQDVGGKVQSVVVGTIPNFQPTVGPVQLPSGLSLPK